jgi:hypothetical protein
MTELTIKDWTFRYWFILITNVALFLKFWSSIYRDVCKEKRKAIYKKKNFSFSFFFLLRPNSVTHYYTFKSLLHHVRRLFFSSFLTICVVLFLLDIHFQILTAIDAICGVQLLVRKKNRNMLIESVEHCQ